MTGMAVSLSAMLVPVDGGKARRKIATYGKAARRQIPGYTQPAVVKTNPASEIGAWEDDHKQRYGIETGSISPSISVHTTTTGSGRVFVRSPRSRSLGEKRGDGPSAVGFRSIVLPPLERADENAVINSRLVYDVPSSGEEQNLEHDLGRASMRKRRKVEPSTIRDSFDVVNDDASLQRHIAAEARDETSRVSSKIKGLSLERKEDYQQVRVSKAQQRSCRTSIVGEHPLSITRASRGTLTTPIKKVAEPQREVIQRATRTRHGPTPEPMSRRQRLPMALSPARANPPRLPPDVPLPPAEPTPASSPGRILGGVYQETAVAPTMQKARLRTPSPSHKSIALATTPRQRELWSMLLTEGNQETSPDRLDIKKLCLTTSRSAKHPSLGLGTQHSKTAVGRSLEQPRRRLVDKLYGQQGACSLLDGNFGQDTDMSDTESNDNSSAVSLAHDSNNVAPSLTGEVQSTGLTTRVELFQRPSQSVPLLPGGGPKVTYARQRSYLTECDLDEAASFGAPIVQDPDGWSGMRRQGRRSEVRVPKQNFPVEDQVEEGDGVQGGAVRSIHELREAGGNVRLASDMESLIDDLDEKMGLPLAVRRRRLLLVVVKLQSPTFCRRFIDHGLVHRLMAHAESSTDLVSNILLAASTLYLVARKDSTDTRHLVIEQRTMDFLIRILDNDVDITTVARDRRNNMSKVAQKEFSELRGSLLEPSLWTNGPPPKVTTRVLAIQCLEYVVRQLREKGSTVDFMSQTAIKRMVKLLVPAPLRQSPSATASEAFALKLAISTLESCTISTLAMCDETAWTGETIDRLTGLLPTIETWPESEEMFGSLRTLVLRLYLNITNNNPSVCEAFSRPEVVRAMFRIIISHFHSLTDDAKKDTQALLLDNLILSLGFLINLAEWSDSARRLVLSFECDTDSPLGTLLQLFQRKLQRAAEAVSEEETSFNVAFGYLSVLLSNLCINGVIREQVRSRLQGGTLKQLLDAVEEFLHYHRQVDDQFCDVGEEIDVKVGFVGRLQSVVDRLKQVDGQA